MSDTSTTSKWKPILTGELADKVRDRANKVSQDILAQLPKYEQGERSSADPWISLLYAYLWADDTNRDDYEEVVGDMIETAVERFSENPSPALYGGAPKAGWLVAHIDREMVDDDGVEDEEDDEDDEDTGLDEYLIELMENSPGQADYDLISGLVGTGVYALERDHTPTGKRLLGLVVDRLYDRHIREGAGITWHSAPETLPAHQRVTSPDGYFNLGLAHGVPGVVALLAECVERGIAAEKAAELLPGTVEWLLSKRVKSVIGGGYDSTLPGPVDNCARPQGHCRVAWCYGGLGVAASLMVAAQRTGNKDWMQAAIDTGVSCAEKTVEQSGSKDAGLCHGDIGNAHVFNRMYQGSGEERFAEIARAYYEHSFTHVDDSRGIGGFQEWTVDRMPTTPGDMNFIWADSFAFLTGSAGIGLGLLAAVSDVAPNWDRLLMTNIRSVI